MIIISSGNVTGFSSVRLKLEISVHVGHYPCMYSVQPCGVHSVPEVDCLRDVLAVGLLVSEWISDV